MDIENSVVIKLRIRAFELALQEAGVVKDVFTPEEFKKLVNEILVFLTEGKLE